MFLFAVRTYVRSLESNGYVLSLAFATLLSRDAIMLALSDGILVASTAICVPFSRAVSKGWIRYYWTGVILQHLLQTTILFTVVIWTFNR
jgi:sterol O-acyltransferase